MAGLRGTAAVGLLRVSPPLSRPFKPARELALPTLSSLLPRARGGPKAVAERPYRYLRKKIVSFGKVSHRGHTLLRGTTPVGAGAGIGNRLMKRLAKVLFPLMRSDPAASAATRETPP